ncbi:MAG: ribosomal protein S18 acetylase RimI-like enzyme [Pseudomonadales bacterium]|jgi:ribosomal protein S18 acetylase RimI-like enzyme
MSIEDVELVLKWAADEGWNPGLDDASAFFQADPAGFLMVKNNGKTAAGISVVKQGEDNGFLGLYICHPEHRGQGIGWTVWQAGMQYLEGRTIGLDGVPEQQDNYRKSGFEYHYRNVRFSGKASGIYSDAEITALSENSNLLIRMPEPDDLESIQNLDYLVHGLHRHDYLQSWLTNIPTRKTLICKHDNQLVGFGTIRACVDGYKIGPLIAQRADIAQMLISALANSYGTNKLIVDVPEPNSTAVDLVKRLGLTYSFETARMYRGAAPKYQLQMLFGVTSFELG